MVNSEKLLNFRPLINLYEMFGRSLITCPEAYSKSLKCFYAVQNSKHPTFECIEGHLPILIGEYVRDRQKDQSPFCILSVGSGDGGSDMAFLEILCKSRRGKDEKVRLFERAIEPNLNYLEAFRAKVEHLPDGLKSRANIEFEYNAVTYQEYVEQKKEDDVKFDVVHFFHSVYYTHLETALEHCYGKELGTKGVILCIIASENSAFVQYGKTFSSHGMILNPGAYYSNRDVKGIAEKNGWRYVECPGETKPCDITAIFDASSEKGNRLLDFLTHWVDVRATASADNLRKILNFWEIESVDDGHGRKLATMTMGAIIIFKGI